MDLFIYPLQRLLHLFAVGFATTDKIFEEDGVVNDFNMESEESAIVADADTVDMLVSDKMFAVGHIFEVIGVLDLLDDAAHGLQHFAGQTAYRFFKTFRIADFHPRVPLSMYGAAVVCRVRLQSKRSCVKPLFEIVLFLGGQGLLAFWVVFR